MMNVEDYVAAITEHGRSKEERTELYSLLCGLVDAVRQQDGAYDLVKEVTTNEEAGQELIAKL